MPPSQLLAAERTRRDEAAFPERAMRSDAAWEVVVPGLLGEGRRAPVRIMFGCLFGGGRHVEEVLIGPRARRARVEKRAWAAADACVQVHSVEALADDGGAAVTRATSPR
jgi:hypothetical protein